MAYFFQGALEKEGRGFCCDCCEEATKANLKRRGQECHHGDSCLRDEDPAWKRFEVPKWSSDMTKAANMFEAWASEQRTTLWKFDEEKIAMDLAAAEQRLDEHRNARIVAEAAEESEDDDDAGEKESEDVDETIWDEFELGDVDTMAGTIRRSQLPAFQKWLRAQLAAEERESKKDQRPAKGKNKGKSKNKGTADGKARKADGKGGSKTHWPDGRRRENHGKKGSRKGGKSW